MLFARRHKPTLAERIRRTILPQGGWPRTLRYFGKRVMRISASPHAVGAGFAAGAAASMTPFIGFHFLLSFLFAFLVRGNMLAAALGTAIGNPITFPLIWFSTFEVGNWTLALFGREVRDRNAEELTHGLLHRSFSDIWPMLKPMIVGSVPLGIIAFVIGYVVVSTATRGFQRARRERMTVRRRALHDNRDGS